MSHEALKVLAKEFRLWGVRFETRMSGSNHIELLWQASPDKERRSYFIAKTPSDGRGTLNARADIRRLFRADGLTLKEEKRPTQIEKALTLPVHTKDTTHDQVVALRAEVADLSDLVMELADIIKNHYIVKPKRKYTRRTNHRAQENTL